MDPRFSLLFAHTLYMASYPWIWIGLEYKDITPIKYVSPYSSRNFANVSKDP